MTTRHADGDTRARPPASFREPGASCPRHAWTSRILGACVLLALALAVWRDRASPVAGALRLNEPIAGLLSVRFKGQGRVVPPALYLLVHGPAENTLDLVVIPASTPVARESTGRKRGRTLADVYGEEYATDGLIPGASRAMAGAALALLRADASWPRRRPPAFWLELELPADARPAFPDEMKRRLVAWAKDPLFWPRFPAAARGILGNDIAGLKPYDAFLLATRYQRLDPERVHLGRMPGPELISPFLKAVFSHAAGLPETDGPVTVEVLNAMGTAGVAFKATKVLRWKGFDVVHFGDARVRERTTRFMDRVGRPDGTRAVIAALGCPDSEVLTAMEERPRASVMVLIGGDYARCSQLREE
ncbi:MAG: LytR C-terminal domain-containing protein [Elusimicrobiota bacterium]